MKSSSGPYVGLGVLIVRKYTFFLWILIPILLFKQAYDADASVWMPASSSMSVPSTTLIIDAGHGGEDGGAVSVTGVSESQINLSISRNLEDTLAFFGLVPHMLRREDISLHDQTAATLREKKVSDLHNRVAQIEESLHPVVLSIHQNSYPVARYRGAQVFFAPTEGSEEWARNIQSIRRMNLDPDHVREIKQIPDNVYLMNHISCPAVLVECGFLSNPEEEKLLRQDYYQRKIAVCLASAVLTAPDI